MYAQRTIATSTTLPISLVRPLNYRLEKLIKRKGQYESVCEGLKILRVEKEGGRDRVPVLGSPEDKRSDK